MEGTFLNFKKKSGLKISAINIGWFQQFCGKKILATSLSRQKVHFGGPGH